MTKANSARIANKCLDWRFMISNLIAFIIAFCTKAFGGPYWGAAPNLFLIVVVILLAMFWFCNLNKNFLNFKKYSLAVWWKTYNFITLSIAIWILERANRFDEFNEKKTLIEGDAIACCNLIAWFVGSLDLSLIQGMLWTKKMILGVMIFVVMYLIYRAIVYYFDQNSDTTVEIFNQTVSMRNQIVNRSLDLAFWIGYQAYQLYTHPNHFQIKSKLEIEWH